MVRWIIKNLLRDKVVRNSPPVEVFHRIQQLFLICNDVIKIWIDPQYCNEEFSKNLIAWWPKHVFVKRPKARYATTEQLIAVFFH